MKKTLFLIAMLSLAVLGVFANIQAVSPDSPDYDAWKMSQVYSPETVAPVVHPSTSFDTVRSEAKDGTLLYPLDGTYTLAMGPNDDGYTSELPLPFTFNLYGVQYNSCWINNNGNITFDMGYSSYTPWGFPINGAPMLAPFFADVDTRGAGSVWYKMEDHRVIVTWDHVGYYGYGVDRLNTFQVIFTDGTDASIGLGNNVAFSYGDLAWTTGSASGGSGGLGGTPATVGVNAGDGVLYAQTGRFDHEGYDYDGAYGNNDGIDWLDWVIFYYDTSGAQATLTITPQAPINVYYGPGLPVGTTYNDEDLSTYYATYPIPGTQDVYLPVGAGTWWGWIYYGGVWHQADVFPVVGPGTIVFSDVPFTGGKEDHPIVVDGESEVVLPLQLSAFTAVMNAENYVNIQWTTQSETSLSGFYVFRGTTDDVSQAMQITALIDPTNSSEQNQYSHVDNTLEEEGVYYYWLQVAEMDGSFVFHGPTSVNYTQQVDQPEVPVLVPTTGIRSIYPNPITPYSAISYQVVKGAEIKFQVFNARGQMVNSFNEGFKPDGSWKAFWNGKDYNGVACPSGIYFIKMFAGNESFIRRAVIMK